MAKSWTNLGPIDLRSCFIVCNRLLSFQEYFTIDHLHFSYVIPLMPLHPLSPPWQPPCPTPVQASSGWEWYYCRSAWHVIGLWVYAPPHHPLCPLNSPRYRHLVAKSGTNMGPIDLKSCVIICNRPSCLVYYLVFNRPCLVLMSTSSLQYTIFSFQEYIFSCVKFSPFLQYLPKYALLSSSLLHNTLNKVVWNGKIVILLTPMESFNIRKTFYLGG